MVDMIPGEDMGTSYHHEDQKSGIKILICSLLFCILGGDSSFLPRNILSFFAMIEIYALADRLTLLPSQLLVPLVSSFRYEGDEVNMTLAKSEAKILHEKISEKAYNHEELIRILTTRSKAQLNATLNHYNNEFGNSINKVFNISYEVHVLSLGL